MGGICGIIQSDGAPLASGSLQGMVAAAAQRGKDGIGYWESDSVGLAHLALNITPESRRESQPLVEGNLILVADARLDNRSELIRALAAQGYLAQPGPTDADVILAAYRRWGLDCAAHLIGDFAFAIWDGGHRRLFAARDVMGLRPLYYRPESGRFLFASEVAQILAGPDVAARLFEPAIGAHLAGYYEMLEWTFYDGVLLLLPGHALVFEGSQPRTWRYWDVDFSGRIRYRDDRDYARHFLGLFQEAVRARLRSTRPVGLFLSGGLDSTSIAATAGSLCQDRQLEPAPALHTYSWAFSTLADCDERFISDPLADHFGLPTTHIPAEACHPLVDPARYGPDRDEPSYGAFQVLIEQALAHAQHQGLSLMLMGSRGDLTMGQGVLDYLGLLTSGRWLTLWRDLQEHSRWAGLSVVQLARLFLFRPIGTALFPHSSDGRASHLGRKLLRLPEESTAYPDWINASFARQIDLGGIMKQRRPPRLWQGSAVQQRYSFIFSALNMRDMAWLERLTARYGLGLADPWSDRRIVTFCLAVPQRVLNRPRELKRLVREAMRGVMPEEARLSARKIYPTPFVEQSLKEWGLETIRQLITDSQMALRGYVDGRKLTDYFRDYCAGKRSDPLFWNVLTLEMWLRQHH